MGSGFKTFTTASVLTASDVNNFLMEQTVMSFASTGARDVQVASPETGMVAYIGSNDVNEGLYHRTSASTWRKGPGWNAPWGLQGVATASSNQTGIGSTVADVTSLTVTWTAVANRRYMTKVVIPTFSQATSKSYVTLYITDSSNSVKQSGNQVIAAGDDGQLNLFVVESSIAAGSATRKARISTTAGSGIITGGAAVVPTIIVEDIGPSGAPA
jgi:hypothetical protein